MAKGKLKATRRAFALFLSIALATSFGMPTGSVYADSPETTFHVTDDDSYKLVWSDEFDGPELSDAWNVEAHDPGWVNAELQRYVSKDDMQDNIKLEDGELKIYPTVKEKASGEEVNPEILKGNGFDSNWADGSTPANGSVSFAEGKATVTITDPGTANYLVQLQQTGLKLIPGHKYAMKFNAVSNVARSVEVSFIDPSNNYAWYGGKKTILGTEEETVSEEFTVSSDKKLSSTIAMQINFGMISDYDDPDWSAQLQAASVAATVTLSDVSVIDLTVQETAQQKKVLKGDGFDSNWVNSSTPANGSVSFAEGKATVTVTDPGTANYLVQIQQAGLTLIPGHTYQMTMDAVSDVDRSVEVSFIDPQNDYKWYGGKKTIIGTEAAPVATEFTVSDDLPKSSTIAMQINFGLISDYDDPDWSAQLQAASVPATITLSNVSVIDVTEGGEEEEVFDYNAYDYTSGRVNTQGNKDFIYGYFEAKARVPKGMGYLPAFWLMATDESEYGSWPKCGEIDIMEVMGQDTTKSYHTIHYGYNPTDGHKQQQKEYVSTDPDFYTEEHVYGLEWLPGKLTWYVDGKEVFTTDNWVTGNDESTQLSYPAPYDHQMYVILNLAIGGEWVGYPDKDAVEDMANQSFDIDYVRVYQKSAEEYKAMEESLKAPEKKKVSYRTPDDEGNFVVNGNFAKALKGADEEGDNFLLHLESECSDSTAVVAKNEVTITPTDVGKQTYSVQLKQEGVPMIKGWNYELSFDAYADEARTMIVDIEGPDNGWVRYFEDTTVDLTTKKKTYTFSFAMENKTDANGCLEFNLGQQGSTAPVHISNVKLTHTSGSEIVEERGLAPDGNYVYNGTFDQGEARLGYWDVETANEDAEVTVTNEITEKGKRERELQVKIVAPAGTSEVNPVIITQGDLAPLVKGKYQLSFDAYMADGETDGMKAIVSGKKYLPTLTTERKNHDFIIDMDESLSREDSYVAFMFSKPGTYYLDNVRIVEAAMVKNGAFDGDVAGYTTYIQADAKADATFSVANCGEGHETALDVNIQNIGTEDFHVQFKQSGVKLEKGHKYKLSFDAKSTEARKISVCLQRDGSQDPPEKQDWSVYSGDDYKLYDATIEWKTFSRTFVMEKETDENALYSVALGYLGEELPAHHVYFDNLTVVELNDQDEVIDISSRPASDEDKTGGEEELKAIENAVAVGRVNDVVANVPKVDDITADDEDAVNAAIEALNNLTPEQQAIVSQDVKDKLEAAKAAVEAAKKEIADTKAAKGVVNTIAELPETIKTSDKAAIEAARKAYEGLTPEQKAKVSAEDLQKLVDAEKALKAAEEKEAADKKVEADKKAAKAVTDKINALPAAGNIKTTHKAAINAARKAFNALTKDQKSYVTKATQNKLTAAEKALKTAEKVAADKAAAKKVTQKINKLPAPSKIKPSNKKAVQTVEKAYKALTAAQKTYVSKATKNRLKKIKNALTVSINKAAAKKVTQKINKLPAPSKVKRSNKAAIKAAEKAYKALTAAQKKYVSKATKTRLKKVKAALAKLK
ncbi:MAG: carbohydrate binding domain-containing protein [Eubacterium sp.]|nr:carbohydrate binding domain-containing protein [Eubacterium sp.]